MSLLSDKGFGFGSLVSRINASVRSYVRNPYMVRSLVFLGSLVGGTALIITFCFYFIVWEQGNLVYPAIWLACFAFLTFDLVANVVCSFWYLFTRSVVFPQVVLEKFPTCAILYPVRNEDFGLYERIEYTFANNNLDNTTLFFLSDSSSEFFAYESDVVRKLRNTFGDDRIVYCHRRNPENAKPGNIQNWLNRYHRQFEYFFVCDADSIIPKNVLSRLLCKAEHPANKNIGIFQSKMRVAHAKTIFSKHQSLGVYISQQLYTDVKQRIFGCALSYGHNNLIRTAAFRHITVPKEAMSHDIWDMALLSQKGYRTVFCSDVSAYEEVPSNYVEMRRRDRRWIKGNFQSLLLLKERRMSLGAYMYVLYGGFMYLCQPVFLFWIIFSLMGNSTLFGKYLVFKPIMGIGAVPLYFETYHFAIIILAFVYFHKFVICRSFRDAGRVLEEIVLSTLITLNNIVYHTGDLISIIFRSVAWVPMNKDPFQGLSLWHAVLHMWPSTVVGSVLLLFVINFYSHMSIFMLPIITAFCLSIPVVYVTAIPYTLKKRKAFRG